MRLVSPLVGALVLVAVGLAAPPAVAPAAELVGSRRSDVYHLSTCRHVHAILAANQRVFSSPRHARRAGYRACRVCLNDDGRWAEPVRGQDPGAPAR